MITPTITIRVPKEIQTKAKSKAKKMGISLTLVVQKALHTFIQSSSLTLTENGFTPEFEDFILQSEKSPSSKAFTNPKDAIAYLKNS